MRKVLQRQNSSTFLLNKILLKCDMETGITVSASHFFCLHSAGTIIRTVSLIMSEPHIQLKVSIRNNGMIRKMKKYVY